MSEVQETHIGDGLYCSFDGWHFCLRTVTSTGDEHRIYLEIGYRCTLETFLDFVDEQLAQAEIDAIKAEEDDERKQAASEGFTDD